MKWLFTVVLLVGCGDGLMKAPEGEPCTRDSECEMNNCVIRGWGVVEFPDGMCAADCTDDYKICLDDQECLVNMMTGDGLCINMCTSDDDCREGYLCTYVWPYGFCLPESMS